MAMKWARKKWLGVALAALVLLIILVVSFRPAPLRVDSVELQPGPFQLVIEEEGRTRLPERYEVSAPVSGHLHRVLLEPGDKVKKSQPLFSLYPALAEGLDARSRAQAEATVSRAEATLAAVHSRIDAEEAEVTLAEQELMRVERLVSGGFLPREALDRARARLRTTQAVLRSARFSVDVAQHELDNARAALSVAAGQQSSEAMSVSAPIAGVVLSRERQSEGRVQAGETILTLGDLDSLQVEVDVLSPDAVRLQPGMRVELERWGGERMLPGRVRRIEPSGFTRVSALGVEEQRVWVIVDFDVPRVEWLPLGDSYRVEARFILWEGEEVLQMPASALFQEQGRWHVFVIVDGRAVKREVAPGRRSGLQVEVNSGLAAGERVILHPGQQLSDGRRVTIR